MRGASVWNAKYDLGKGGVAESAKERVSGDASPPEVHVGLGAVALDPELYSRANLPITAAAFVDCGLA